MRKIINLERLAQCMNAPLADVQIAGTVMFERLCGNKPSLTQALVEASAASKLSTQEIMRMLSLFADECREPVKEESTLDAISAGVHGMTSAASDRIQSASASVRDTVSSIDLGSIKDGGEQMLGRVREDLAANDGAGIKDRAMSAGSSLIEKARSLASGGKKDAVAPDESGSSKQDQ